MNWKYALPESRKWQEHVRRDCAAYELEIRTAWESKVAGACQAWLCCSWIGNTYILTIKSGGNISALIMPRTKRNYTLPESQHSLLSPTMIASPRLGFSVYPFSHPLTCFLDLQMEECHPPREWNMNLFCMVDFVQGPNRTQTLSWWYYYPLKNTG